MCVREQSPQWAPVQYVSETDTEPIGPETPSKTVTDKRTFARRSHAYRCPRCTNYNIVRLIQHVAGASVLSTIGTCVNLLVNLRSPRLGLGS